MRLEDRFSIECDYQCNFIIDSSTNCTAV